MGSSAHARVQRHHPPGTLGLRCGRRPRRERLRQRRRWTCPSTSPGPSCRPMMTASGCAANGRELHRFFDVAELAFVTKSVMAAPRSGRGTPRMAETPSGMLNSIGLQALASRRLSGPTCPGSRGPGARPWFSIAGSTSGEFADVAATLRASEVFDAVSGGRGQHLLPQRRQPRPRLRATRWRRPRSSPWCASSCRGTSPSSSSRRT